MYIFFQGSPRPPHSTMKRNQGQVQFHKSLPKYSVHVHWISVKNYEINVKKKQARPVEWWLNKNSIF